MTTTTFPTAKLLSAQLIDLNIQAFAGTAMKWGCLHGLASQHKQLGVALRAVLYRPSWGGAIRMRNAMLQATMPVGYDVDWLGAAASPVII